MSIFNNAFRRVADWSGRSRRSEFWGFFLINLIITASLAVLSQTGAGFAIAYLVYALVVLFPGLGVTVRRLHDCGKSGGWVLLGFVPILGLSPNPPMDTDGRREDTGRGVRKLQAR